MVENLRRIVVYIAILLIIISSQRCFIRNDMTAVEYLVEQVEQFIGLIPVDVIEKAKEMERQDKENYSIKCDSIRYYNEED